MNWLGRISAFLLLAVAVCLGPSAAAQSDSGAGDSNSVHGVIPVSLVKSIDSKKLKEGDEIPAKTVATLRTSSGIVIPAGSKVVGHVTQAKARSKGDPDSSLSISFDKIEVPGGKDMPIKGVMAAVGPNPSESSGPDTGAAGAPSLGGRGGQTTTASPVSGPGVAPGQEPGKQGGKTLTPSSTGVVGIKNLQLENNVLTSSGKEVKLDSGSQMMIKME